jgi:crotonobetainyl-CoA:carnitine CoA-transferase CaiB-like acyl-CoA transferase
VRVVALEQFGAGPFATLQLADLGAEVIKVEDPAAGGDVGRYVPPGQTGSDSLYFESFNRGKRSILLDLKSAAGREVFERLVATADVVFNNLRGDLPDALGLTYGRLGSVNPRIVCVTLSAYGRTGDRRAMPGYDALIQAEAGWAAVTGDPSDPPTKSGLSVVDYAAGLATSFGIMVGLHDAQRTGRGRDIDLNLYDTAISLLTYPAAWFLSAGVASERLPLSAHPSIVPFQFFQTKDGYVAIACAKERFFQELAAGIGRPELAADARFATFKDRLRNRAELSELLSRRLRERTNAEWLGTLSGRVPIAPVRSLSDALSLDELQQRGMLAEYGHETLGQVRAVGSPVAIDGYERGYRAGPRLGADRDNLLESIGYTRDAIDDLAARGAFGEATPQTQPARSADLDA